MAASPQVDLVIAYDPVAAVWDVEFSADAPARDFMDSADTLEGALADAVSRLREWAGGVDGG